MGTIEGMKTVLVHKEFTHAKIALGYAFCLFDFPQTWINEMNKKFNLAEGGYFVIVDKNTGFICHQAIDNKITKLEEPEKPKEE